MNKSQHFDSSLDRENGTMDDYNQIDYVEINKKIDGFVFNQEIEEANMEIYAEELQAEENVEKLDEANLVKVRQLDEVFTTSKEELNKLCEIKQIETQNKIDNMEEIELYDATEKAKYEINKCLKMNDDCIVNKYKNKRENLEMNGVELGVYEVDRNKNNVASEFLFNKNLIMEGNSELYKQLLEATKNGAKLALNMLKIYQSEPKTREASINYTIAGIWIRNEPKIKESMKNVAHSKNMLIKDSLNNTLREDIFTGILNVAKLEIYT
uniref:Uncharacterized protein n=1 Tax=Meloidogyne javanica TaxID=6303 RepID=A0A915N1I0_MELJA